MPNDKRLLPNGFKTKRGMSTPSPDNPHTRTVKLLQITDTHLLADRGLVLGGFDTEASFQKVVARLRKDLPVDAILVSGDLADRGECGAYEKLRDALEPLDTPVFCIAGNHDDPAMMRAVFSSGAVRYVDAYTLGAWAIVFLCTQIPQRVDGELTTDELLRLEKHLREFRNKHVLVCLHHHPVLIGSSWMDGMRLANPEPLFEILDAYENVQAVLWGHIHQEFSLQRNGVRLLGSPSTCLQFVPGATQFDPDDLPPGYRWLDLLSDGSLETGIHWAHD
jgi:Icc protein